MSDTSTLDFGDWSDIGFPTSTVQVPLIDKGATPATAAKGVPGWAKLAIGAVILFIVWKKFL